MKKVLIFISLVTFLNMTGQNMSNEDFWKEDKIKHSVGVFGISSITYAYLSIHSKHKNLNEFQKRLISLSTAIVAGSLKEVIDGISPNNEASWADMGANMAGALAFQVAITIPLNIKSKNKKVRDIAYHKN
tara:strand:- start:4730 stop:5122 length:393 start_codon:yes stop_codon:yes gene_type:complete